MSLNVTPTVARKTKTDETSPDDFASGTRRKSERRVKIPNNFGEYDVTISALKKKQLDDSDEKMGSGSDEDSEGSVSARTNKSSKNANNDADSEPRPSKGKERTKGKKAKESDEPSRKSNKKASKAASKSDDDDDAKEEDDGSGNHDQCDACGDGGSLLCCDACPRAFHIDCCPLPLDRNALPDKWFCHQCILEIQKKPNDPNMPFLKGEILAYAALCLSAKRLGDSEKKREKKGKAGPFSAIYLGLGVTNPRSYSVPNAVKKIDRRSEVRFMQFKDIMKNPEMGKQRYATEDKYVDSRSRQKMGPECTVCGCGPVTNNAYRAKPIQGSDRFDVFGLLKCSLCDRHYHAWCLDTFFLEAHSWGMDGSSTDFDWTCPRHRIPDPNEDSKHLPAYRRLEEMVQPTAPLPDPSVVSNYILLDSYLPYFLNFEPFTIPVKRLPKEEKPFYQKPYVVQLTSDPNKIAAAPMYYAPAPDANLTESRKRERTRNSYDEKRKELASRDTFKTVEKTQRANIGKDEMLKMMMQKMNVDLSQFVMPVSDVFFVEDMADQFEEELDVIFAEHPRLKHNYEYLQGVNRGMKQLAECQRLTKLIPSRPRRVQAQKDIKKMKFAKREELFVTHMNQLKSEVDAILNYIAPKELLAYFPLGDSKSLGEPSDSTTSTRAAAQMTNLRKSGNGENGNGNGDGENGEHNDSNMGNSNNNAGSGGDDDRNNKRKNDADNADEGDGGDDDDENNEDEEGEVNADDDDWEYGEKKRRTGARPTRALRRSSNTVMSDATQPESVMSVEKTDPVPEQQSEERLRQMQSLLWANMSPVFLQFLAWQRLVDIGQHLERSQQIANMDSNDDRVQKILSEAHKQDDMIATHMSWLDTWKNNLDMQQQVINPRPTKRARPKTENDDDEPPNKRRKQDKSESPNTGSLSGNITATVASMYNLPAPSISPPVTPTPASLAKKQMGSTVMVTPKPIAPAGPVALLPKPGAPKAVSPPTRGPTKSPFTRAANLPRDTKPPAGQTKHTWKVPLPDQPIRGAIASLTGVSEFDSQPFQFNMFAHKICIGRGMPMLEFDVAKYTDCKTISHRHAQIEFNPDKKCFIFSNLGRNGTRINEEQIGGKAGVNIPLVLYPGDVIEMGRFRMTFNVYKPTGVETLYDQGPLPE